MIRLPTRPLIVIGVLALATVLAATGACDRLLDVAGLGRLAAANDRYLQNSFDRSLKTFGVLSAVKVGLAVVKGTEVGVGFDINVGDVVQATYDYVDVAWRTVLAGGVVLLGFRHVLDSLTLVDRWLLTAALAAALIAAALGLAPRLRALCAAARALALGLTVLAAAAYLAVPLAIQGAAQLSLRITAPSMKAVDDGLASFQDQLEDPGRHDQGLLAVLTKAQQRLSAVAAVVGSKAAELTRWVVRIVAAYVFDCLVFPIGLLVLLLYATKAVAAYLYGVERNRALRDDLHRVLDTYFGRHETGSAARSNTDKSTMP